LESPVSAVDPGLARPLAPTTSGQNVGARVTVEQQVTRDLTVTYVSNVSSSQQQVIQVEYNLKPQYFDCGFTRSERHVRRGHQNQEALSVAHGCCGNSLQELIEDPAAAPIAACRPPAARGGVEFGCRDWPAVHFVRHPDCPAWPFANASLAAFADESRIDSWISRAILGDSAATFCPRGEP